MTLDQLAELTNRDRSYLIRCFKDKLKISPYQYILKLRIDEAMRLIENTDDALLSISKKLGFRSHRNFCDAFKKQTGHTPINYKYIKSIRKG
ncbi:helix-turn-helix domain-containing protein [Flavobacterium sp.]|uniref:helix-turn-helix domain-containing protein n=1 Tax=Flavobacterium sp. TaxID=239 RepID=UPI0037BF1BEA